MVIILKQCSMRSFDLAFLRSIAILANMEREENCRLIDRWIDIVSCVNPMRRTRPRSLLMVVGGNFDTRVLKFLSCFLCIGVRYIQLMYKCSAPQEELRTNLNLKSNLKLDSSINSKLNSY